MRQAGTAGVLSSAPPHCSTTKLFVGGSQLQPEKALRIAPGHLAVLQGTRNAVSHDRDETDLER